MISVPFGDINQKIQNMQVPPNTRHEEFQMSKFLTINFIVYKNKNSVLFSEVKCINVHLNLFQFKFRYFSSHYFTFCY